MEENNIKELLIEVTKDETKIIELERYNIDKIIDVALKEELYDALLIIFKPITINNNTKIYFDAFSTDILSKISNTCNTKEEAEIEAKEEYEHHQALNKTLSEEDKEWYYDDRTYEEILSEKKVISKEIKEKLRKSLFNIDLDKIKRIKIKDSHARQISGIAHPINNIEDVIFYAEPACIESCIDLFNKNIKTTMNDTEGVIEDTVNNGKCFITIDYTTLSEENKAIFEELLNSGLARRFNDGGINSITIETPCRKEETVGEVSNRLKLIASKLNEQDILFGRQTLEDFYNNKLANYMGLYKEIANKYFDKEECTWDDVIDFTKELGFYYDPDEDILWDNKKLYDRHIKYIMNNKEEQIYNTHYENGVETVIK